MNSLNNSGMISAIQKPDGSPYDDSATPTPPQKRIVRSKSQTITPQQFPPNYIPSASLNQPQPSFSPYSQQSVMQAQPSAAFQNNPVEAKIQKLQEEWESDVQKAFRKQRLRFDNCALVEDFQGCLTYQCSNGENTIARHLRLSRSSTTALSESLEYAISDRDNNPDIFPAVFKALEEFDTNASRNAMAYLAPLLRHNIFRHQSVNYSFGIENISLSKFPPLFKNVIVDLLLFDEFRTASQGGQPPRYIYIDEMQNLSIDKDCYLGKILTEGRKYSLNVILASQSIREFNASERTMLCQANHKLLFHPALLEVKYYAELLASPQHRAEISDLLRNLEVGQCVFQGPIYIGEEAKPTCAPICVNVSHLEDIASASLSKSST